MADFVYNNTKNANIGHMFSKLNYDYHLYLAYKDEVNPGSKSASSNKTTKELRELISICLQKLLYTKKLQKQA